MKRLVLLLLAGTLVSCRAYDYRGHVSQDRGLTPAEQYARYGREHAQLVAAGRELAHASADSIQQAVQYARSLPDVADVTADSQATWLTLRFKSGWRVATPPVDDGKRGSETAGVSARQ